MQHTPSEKALKFSKNRVTEWVNSGPILTNNDSIFSLGLNKPTYHWILSSKATGAHLKGYKKSILQMTFVPFCNKLFLLQILLFYTVNNTLIFIFQSHFMKMTILYVSQSMIKYNMAAFQLRMLLSCLLIYFCIMSTDFEFFIYSLYNFWHNTTNR